MQLNNRTALPGMLVMFLFCLLLGGCAEKNAPITTSTSAPATASPVSVPTSLPAPTASVIPPPLFSPVALEAEVTLAANQCQERFRLEKGNLDRKVNPVVNAPSLLPSIRDVQEIELNPNFAAALAGQVPAVNGRLTRLYVSDSEMEQVAKNTDRALTASGYSFSLPCQRGPLRQGDFIVGFYSKAAAPDVLLAIYAVTGEGSSLMTLTPTGITPEAIQQYEQQVKGKKSVLVIYSAPGLLEAIVKLVSLRLNLPEFP